MVCLDTPSFKKKKKNHFNCKSLKNLLWWIPEFSFYFYHLVIKILCCLRGFLGQLVTGLDHGIVTMTKGEIALFTLPPGTEYRGAASDNFRPNEATLFEVELISWITVVDICKDGGILKRILEKGARNEQPSDLDEVIGTLTYYYVNCISS